EFDLKSALFRHMNKNKSANRNLTNYHIYHALMEALIADEDAMDKEVKDKPIPENKRPATPEPEWTIPLNDFPEPENNWANTYATTYKVPEENKLQRKTYDIRSLISA
ncbi:hypothetical protein Tco_1373333, partial [Tanacetum coccineum]